jgi:hypothetical protein
MKGLGSGVLDPKGGQMRDWGTHTAGNDPRSRWARRGRKLGFALALGVTGLLVAPQALADRASADRASADRAHWADGYVWADDPTSSSYDASSNGYAFNRTERPIIITKRAGTTGQYRVRFRGLSALLGAKSTVHVTGYNSDNNYCTPVDPRLKKDVVEVRCYNADTGAAEDSYFTVYVTRSHADVAFAHANRPTASGYSPAASASWNPSATRTIRVTRSGVGTYAVNFRGLGSLAAGNGGHVQVNPVAAGKSQCKVVSWGGSPNLVVNVACFRRAGGPVNAKFNVLFLLPSDHLAYAWADDPTSASYTPDSTYSSNPSGGGITADRSGPGQYVMTWSGAGPEFLDGGDVQVTAYGGGKAQCKVESWGSNDVSVRCFRPTGAPVDSRYVIFYGS